MSLLSYWPSEKNCLDCIKPEAENPADSVFLAVHQPMRFRRKNFNDDTSRAFSEEKLLSEFLRDDPSGRIILPILGESGIGKSHVIRWLDVKLRQLPDASSRHVIRIPKSSSLKTVLGLILDELKGKHYNDIRRQLKNAREQMDAITAKQRVRAELLAAIEKRATSASARIAKAKETGQSPDPKDVLWKNHGDDRYLPAIFGDASTSKLFMQGTEDRPGIFAEIARHLTVDTQADQKKRGEILFEEADFIIPGEFADEVRAAGAHAKKYLERLNGTNARHRQDVTRLLNEVVDDAIAPLASPQDTSLSELFYEIRRQLLKDDKELVLLVEDFAVLAGIQGALLDAMIREGEVSGKTEACVMRTALAVTTGYFEQFETVKTRAIHGWYIDEVPEDEEDATIDRMCDFFGAYLNAARIGATGLHEHYDQLDGEYVVPSFTEATSPEEETIGLLNAFEKSSLGHELFPFNRRAVAELADWRARDSRGRLKFNPRSLLNDILLPILRGYRDSFDKGDFPPNNPSQSEGGFLGYDPNRVNTTLRNEVSRTPHAHRDRLLTLLCFWGGNPNTLKEASIPTGVYESFKLAPLDGAPTKAPATKPRTEEPPKPKAPVPPTEPDESKAIRTWREHLGAWRKGTQLPQLQARRLRTMIRDHLLQWVDWDAELLAPLKKEDVDHEKVYLPNSKGGPTTPDKAILVVATDDHFGDADVAARVETLVLSLVKVEENKGWNYLNAEYEYSTYSNFFEERIDTATDWLRSNYKRVSGDPVPATTQSLLWGGRLLNIDQAHSREDVGLINSAFATTEERRNADERWGELFNECQQHRDGLQKEILLRLAARQGGAKSVFAIDPTPLLAQFKSMRKAWEVSSDFPKPYTSDQARIDLERHTKELRRFGPSVVKKWREAVLKQSQAVMKRVGEEFDKTTIVKDLQTTIDTAKQFGLRAEVSASQMSTLLERFRESAATDCLKHVRTIESADNDASLVSALAQLDTETLGMLSDFVDTASKYITQIESEAVNRTKNWDSSVVEEEQKRVDALLAEIQLLIQQSLGGAE